jgi:hypothetical protein
MMFLNVFAKPLHIPDEVRWILIVGVFVPLTMVFQYLKVLKQEQAAAPEDQKQVNGEAGDPRRKVKNRLLLGMAFGVMAGLAAPFWMPITGTSLGMKGDFLCGLFSAAVLCTIFGLRIRKL